MTNPFNPEDKRAAVLLKVNRKLKFPMQLSLDLQGQYEAPDYKLHTQTVHLPHTETVGPILLICGISKDFYINFNP